MQFSRHQDNDAFQVLVERHGPLVMGVCRQILRHDHDVDDAFQATFMVLSLKARSINRSASIASWLYRVAFRTAMRAAKQRQRRQTDLLREDAIVSDDPLAKIHEQSINKALHEELCALPDSYRAPLVLCYLQQRSRQEAASQLECTESSVKARLARGKRLLRLKLARRGIGLSIAIGIATQDVAEAALPMTSDLVARTVTACSDTAASGSLRAKVCSQEVVTLTKQGMQTMIVPSIVKTTAAILAVGAAAATFSIQADDNASSSGSSSPAAIQLPVDSSGEVTPEITAAPSSIASSSERRSSLNVVAQVAPLQPSPTRPSAPLRIPTVRQVTNVQPAETGAARRKLEIRKLQVQRNYLKAKSDAYRRLEKAYLFKIEEAKRAKEHSQFEIAEADAQATLNAAEAKRFEWEAEILAATIELLKQEGDDHRPVVRASPPSTTITGWPIPHRKTTPPTAATSAHNELPLESPEATAASRHPAVLQVGTRLNIRASGILDSEPIDGIFVIEPETLSVALGPSYGRVKIAGLSLLDAEKKIREHLELHYKAPRVQVTIPVDAYAHPIHTPGSIPWRPVETQTPGRHKPTPPQTSDSAG